MTDQARPSKRDDLARRITSFDPRYVDDVVDAILDELMEPREGALAAASRINNARDIEIWQAMLTAIKAGE